MKLGTSLLAASSAALLVIGLAGCSFLGETVGQVVDVDGDTSVLEITAGDCINDAESTAAGDVSDVTKVKCTEPHDYEAFHSLTLPDGDYPGQEAVETQAEDVCYTEFETFVGISYDESVLGFTYFTPTTDGWESGDHEIVCLLADLDAEGATVQSSVSLEGSKR
ncbi:septum formation protein [Glaciihabitans arcticus]|uniref:Septum formation protein n=1 Tax=Glaciihabitans arcticus TaxID=2668039 RepID=A0A4Q9GN69_9MICO|nr:septum formation family protein [Glaciihabitans arcticus]TBN56242.1 septum formation protein [Glaciihabitans arcticus]